jgi:glycosyltransferase involved in cell wall biosynthesis
MNTTSAQAPAGTAAAAHVLHIGPDMHGPGGMPAVIRTLLASPLAEQHELSFLRTYGSSSPVRRLLTFGRGLVELAAWCRRPGERLVHVHTATRGSWYRKAIAVALVKSLDRPVVLHYHAGVGDIRAFEAKLGPVRLGLLRWAFRQADAVIAVSAASAAEVERIFSFERVAVVPNAAPAVPSGATGVPPEAPRPSLVYLGGFANPAKGSDVLVEALQDVLDTDPDVRVLLAGPGEPTAEAEALMATGRVRWAGYLDAVTKAEALREAQVFVMPSVSEGMPVALLEAMAYGLAIVATDVGGIPEVVTDDREAVLVPARDAAALAGAMRALLADPERRGALGRAARSRAERLNDGEVFGPLDTVYRAAVAPGVRPAPSAAATFRMGPA